jgi:hypothetical protein
MDDQDKPVIQNPEGGTSATAVPEQTYGVVAEFETPERLIEAIGTMRGMGYRKLDAFTSFPVHGIDEALGIRSSKLGWIVLFAGLFGAASALLMQWWTGAVDYPLVIGGKPFFAVEFSIPVTFELTVLFAAFGAVIGMLAFNGLPRLYHPIFQYSKYAHATDDRFLLAVEASGPDFDATAAVRILQAAGGRSVEVVPA